jgi:hypothetical protein
MVRMLQLSSGLAMCGDNAAYEALVAALIRASQPHQRQCAPLLYIFVADVQPKKFGQVLQHLVDGETRLIARNQLGNQRTGHWSHERLKDQESLSKKSPAKKQTISPALGISEIRQTCLRSFGGRARLEGQAGG